jgi:hypothetical protein
MGKQIVDTQSFFETLYPDMTGRYLEIRRLPSGGQYFCTSIDQAASFAATDRRDNVYFGVALRSDQKGDEEHAALIPALWVDVDAKDHSGDRRKAAGAISQFEFKPSAIVDTGNGFHVYYFLREPEMVTANNRPYLRGLMQGIAESIGGDRACKDLSRILRVPNTLNFKDPEHPKQVQLIRWHPERRYNLSDFEPYMAEVSLRVLAAPVGDRIPEGQRNQVLTSLGGTMRHRGAYEESVVAALFKENVLKCDPPLSEAEVRNIARSVCRYEPGNVTTAPIGNQNSSNVSEAPPIVLIPRHVSALLRDAPQVIWQVENILPVGSAAVLVGDAGIGKSWMLLALALAVAQGLPWLGEFTTRQGKVLVVDEENADALLKRRMEKLLLGEGLPEDGAGLNIEFLTGQGINLSDDRFVTALEVELDKMRPDLVLIDALVRIHRGNENDAREMAAVFAILKQWTVAYGCSFVFCHHRKKPGMSGNSPANMIRGSSDIRAFVDTHLDMAPVTGEEGVVKVIHSKSRYAEPVASFCLEIADTAPEATVVR